MLEPDELVWLGFEASSLEETEVWLDEVDDSLELLLLDSLDLLKLDLLKLDSLDLLKLDLLKLDLLGLLTLSLDELFVALSFGELHATKENDKARNKDA